MDNLAKLCQYNLGMFIILYADDIMHTLCNMEAVVISEALCFIRNNFDKCTVSELKPVLVTFYNDDELCNAKEVLLKAVTKALEDLGRIVDLPRIPKRVGDNKRQHVIDDLLKLFTIVDEQKLSTPTFVASDLSRVPFLNADSMNMVAMIRKMDSFERRLAEMEQCYVRDRSTSMTAVEDRPSLSVPSMEMVSQNSQEVDLSTDAVSTDADLAATDDNGREAPWNDVVRRHRPAKPPRSQPTQVLNSQVRTQQNRRKMVGTACIDDHDKLKSGVPIIQKAVVHIDNLDPNCTEALLTDYLLAADIEVLSCYPAKSWLRDAEKDQVTAFRVCVHAKQRCKIFHPELWSEGVVIRDWRFKKTDDGGQR